MMEVQLISASWCKRCHVVKPDVAAHCTMNGLVLTIVDYEEMSDEEKATIKSLPTIRMRPGPLATWTIYVTDTLDSFKADLAQASMKQTQNTDF
jgi:hypothetical protein